MSASSDDDSDSSYDSPGLRLFAVRGSRRPASAAPQEPEPQPEPEPEQGIDRAASPPPHQRSSVPAARLLPPPAAVSTPPPAEGARELLELKQKVQELEAEREQHEINSRKALKILQAKDEEIEAKDEELRKLAEPSAPHADAALVPELREKVDRLSIALRDQEEQLAKARQENDELRTQEQTAAAEATAVNAAATKPGADDADHAAGVPYHGRSRRP